MTKRPLHGGATVLSVKAPGKPECEILHRHDRARSKEDLIAELIQWRFIFAVADPDAYADAEKAVKWGVETGFLSPDVREAETAEGAKINRKFGIDLGGNGL